MITINQKPAYKLLPAGQEIIYTIGENTNLLTSSAIQNAKIILTLTVANDSSHTDVIFTSQFKAAPNSAGVCMFDIGQILENGVSPTQSGMFATNPSSISTWQNTIFTETRTYHSIHNIDKFAFGKNCGKYVKSEFQIEYLGADPNNPNVVSINQNMSAQDELFVFNGYLNPTDLLNWPNNLTNDFGYDLTPYMLQNLADTPAGGYITNAPKDQYATINDYGTFAFFNGMNTFDFSFFVGSSSPPVGYKFTVKEIRIILRDSNNVQLGSTITMTNSQLNGGWSGIAGTGDDATNFTSQTKFLFAGVFPANLRGWSADAILHIANTSYYQIQAYDQDDLPLGEEYRIHIVKECLYPPVRIAWLNKFGAWDYYTFLKKSSKNLKSQRKEYTKLRGTWNGAVYNPNRPTGGQMNYLVQTNETIKVNTDYITESEAEWLQELFNSQQMYIVNDYHFNTGVNNINRFVEPVILTTSSYKVKTTINDKLIQYTFDFKRNADRRTQRA